MHWMAEFSCSELVDYAALLAALESGQLGRYVVDFPSADPSGVEKVSASLAWPPRMRRGTVPHWPPRSYAIIWNSAVSTAA